MPLTKLNAFTKKVADLADKPNATMTATQVKAQFDAAPDELRVSFNALIDALKATTAGDSGAKNIGATAITGLTGSDIQTLLEALKTLVDTKSNSTDVYTKTLLDTGQLDNRYYTETELNSGQLDTRYFTETELQNVTSGSSGAKKIGATPIATSPSDVQGILEWLKTQIDSTVLGQIPDGSITIPKLSFDPATQAELDNHSNDAVKHITSAERTQWNGDLTRRLNDVRTLSMGGIV